MRHVRLQGWQYMYIYMVHQQKPDIQNFNSKETLKNRFKTDKQLILKQFNFLSFGLVKRQL